MTRVFFLLLPENFDAGPPDGLISPQRRERAARMTAEAAAGGLAAEALARWALRDGGCALWREPFTADSNGKPGLPGAHFSLSHTRGAVAAAVSDGPVGVDIERLRPAPLRVSDRFFTENEQKNVAERGDEGFFTVWTRKEALLKRSGVFTLAPETLARRDIQTRRFGEYIISVCGGGAAEFRQVRMDELR